MDGYRFYCYCDKCVSEESLVLIKCHSCQSSGCLLEEGIERFRYYMHLSMNQRTPSSSTINTITTLSSIWPLPISLIEVFNLAIDEPNADCPILWNTALRCSNCKCTTSLSAFRSELEKLSKRLKTITDLEAALKKASRSNTTQKTLIKEQLQIVHTITSRFKLEPDYLQYKLLETCCSTIESIFSASDEEIDFSDVDEYMRISIDLFQLSTQIYPPHHKNTCLSFIQRVRALFTLLEDHRGTISNDLYRSRPWFTNLVQALDIVIRLLLVYHPQVVEIINEAQYYIRALSSGYR
jgi:hypothetical protein